jgi:hypothetical protein
MIGGRLHARRRFAAAQVTSLLSALVIAGVAPARAAELLVADGGGDASVDSGPSAPSAPRALARVAVAGPSPRGLTLTLASGYGYTESLLGLGDHHDRAMARLAVEGRPTPWLGMALRFDGRYDHHTIPGQPSDSGMIGDPRIQVRADRALAGGFAVGVRGGLWFPGRNAPSIDLSATTPELLAMASYTASQAPLPITIALDAGYRYDRSARTAPDAAMLTLSDRASLGVSANDAILLGASASAGRGPIQGYLEGSWDLLVGSGSPAPLTSPMILGAGVRLALAETLGLEVAAEVSPSRRPVENPMASLVPIPPRVAAWVGLTYAFAATTRGSSSRRSAGDESPPADAVAKEPAKEPTAAPPPISVPIRVLGADDQPVASVQVFANRAAGERLPLAAGEDGRFALELAHAPDGRPVPVALDVEAPGFVASHVTVSEAPGPEGELTIRLERSLPSGQIRGYVRSLSGRTVDADVEVRAAGKDTVSPQSLRADGGRFEIDVAPGSYEVHVSASGYETQRRRIQVERNGVTLLNVDLRSAR